MRGAPYRAVVAAVVALAGPALPAQAGAERYAGVQLELARTYLREAQTAAARGDHAQAGRLAWQASVDARLTWGMTDSPPLREDASEVLRDAASLIGELTAR